MLTYLRDIWDNLLSIISTMEVVDILDILLLSCLIYVLFKLVRETRAEQLLKGVLIFALILIILNQFEFKIMSLIGETFFNVGLIAIIIMFQPELRRVLEKMGRSKMVKSLSSTFESNPSDLKSRVNVAISQISIACETLSRTATGALIVLERQTRLGEQIDTGTILDAIPSSTLFGTIFFPNTPLHDGAVIIRDGMVLAAGCFLPKPQKEELVPKELGSRHRAAIGMSEVSDAIIIVVSEETGIISTAENGILTRSHSKESLSELLRKRLLPSDISIEDKKAKKSKKARKGKAVQQSQKDEESGTDKK